MARRIRVPTERNLRGETARCVREQATNSGNKKPGSRLDATGQVKRLSSAQGARAGYFFFAAFLAGALAAGFFATDFGDFLAMILLGFV